MSNSVCVVWDTLQIRFVNGYRTLHEKHQVTTEKDVRRITHDVFAYLRVDGVLVWWGMASLRKLMDGMIVIVGDTSRRMVTVS